MLKDKLGEDGQLIIAKPNRKLAEISAFATGQGSEPATVRYEEILDNLNE
jgi:hypothetical protein